MLHKFIKKKKKKKSVQASAISFDRLQMQRRTVYNLKKLPSCPRLVSHSIVLLILLLFFCFCFQQDHCTLLPFSLFSAFHLFSFNLFKIRFFSGLLATALGSSNTRNDDHDNRSIYKEKNWYLRWTLTLFLKKTKAITLAQFKLMRIVGRGAFGKVLLIKHNKGELVFLFFFLSLSLIRSE
jgi:hypothetical protein